MTKLGINISLCLLLIVVVVFSVCDIGVCGEDLWVDCVEVVSDNWFESLLICFGIR